MYSTTVLVSLSLTGMFRLMFRVGFSSGRRDGRPSRGANQTRAGGSSTWRICLTVRRHDSCLLDATASSSIISLLLSFDSIRPIQIQSTIHAHSSPPTKASTQHWLVKSIIAGHETTNERNCDVGSRAGRNVLPLSSLLGCHGLCGATSNYTFQRAVPE